MKQYLHYEHHGNLVWVRADLQGKHREYCLCYDCERFTPENGKNNCTTANLIYALCCECDLVLPVWECPYFNVRVNKDSV